MSTWFTRNLGDALLAEEALDRIQTLFRSEYGDSDPPDEPAVFVRYESEGRLHCDVRLYFPPAMAGLAEKVDAIPCQRPATDGLSLLAGSEQAWTAVFPDSRPG